ncbi:hypothetical protein E2320_008309, partial [Naja naja]
RNPSLPEHVHEGESGLTLERHSCARRRARPPPLAPRAFFLRLRRRSSPGGVLEEFEMASPSQSSALFRN